MVVRMKSMNRMKVIRRITALVMLFYNNILFLL